jgi:hypothetical protein
MYPGGPGGTIPIGPSHKETHAELVPKMHAAIDEAAANGVPNIIVLGGEKRGIAYDEGADNCAAYLDAVKAHAASHKMTFVILKDNGNKIADVFGANKTPEAYFLDANNKLAYHGRIDNNRDIAQVASSELREALDAALAGKPVAKTEAAAFGCSIKRAE